MRREGIFSPRRVVALSTALALTPAGIAATQTENNVVASAEDAFGVALGVESLGLYNDSSVRGFNPLTAGNARMDGLYFDKQGPMTTRLVNDTRIHVGLSALGSAWPAPTGIVDYSLREPGTVPELTSIYYAGPFDSLGVDLDGYTPIIAGVAGVAAGAAYRNDEDLAGLTQRIIGYGVIPQWTPSKNLTVRAFWGLRRVTSEKTLPTIYVGLGQQPPSITPRYFGQSWTEGDSFAEHFGILTNATILDHWTVRAGIFRSIYDALRSYADLDLDTQMTGVAHHVLIGEPEQRTASTSGEVQVSRSLVTGAAQHTLVAGVRARSVGAVYGGTDEIDAGSSLAGQTQPLAPARFNFGPTTRDAVHEWSAGLSYSVSWHERAQLAVGFQRPSYSRRIVDPALGISNTKVDPRLYNVSAAFSPLTDVIVYGAVTRGLEDSGVAPANAVNRGQILGAARTSQEEGGVRYAVSPTLKLVAAVFDVQKPYFNLDDQDRFVAIGQERHRGAELSLTGQVLPGLNLVAGGFFMSPVVIADTAGLSQIGKRPVGQPERLLQVNLDYRLPRQPRLSFDVTYVNQASEAASFDDRARIPVLNTLALGARYRFNLGAYPAMLRLQVLNLTNASSWYIASDAGLQPLEPRRGLAYLTVDI